MQWWLKLREGGPARGPHSTAELEALLKLGQLSPQALVRPDSPGEPEWSPISEVGAFRSALAPGKARSEVLGFVLVVLGVGGAVAWMAALALHDQGHLSWPVALAVVAVAVPALGAAILKWGL